ncbi:MAG: hypothetical protein WC492_00475 [Candidatus Micrarchaeia archaeon]
MSKKEKAQKLGVLFVLFSAIFLIIAISSLLQAFGAALNGASFMQLLSSVTIGIIALFTFWGIWEELKWGMPLALLQIGAGFGMFLPFFIPTTPGIVLGAAALIICAAMSIKLYYKN